MRFFKFSFLLIIPLLFSFCGGSTPTGDAPTLSVTMNQSDSGSSSLMLLAASLEVCNNPDQGDYANLKCIEPSSYTVGVRKIEFLNCGGDCTETDGEITNDASSVTIYESSVLTGLDVDLTTGATIDSNDISEDIEAGDYGGLRFTISYLQQTLSAEDSDLGEEATFRICTMNSGCPDATDSQAGDIMILYGSSSYQWVDVDIMQQEEGGSPLVSTRPDNPLQDEGFANMGQDGNPDGDPSTGFVVEVDNDSNDTNNPDGIITIEDGKTYSVTSTFTIGGAYAFDDENDNDILDITSDEFGNPGKPASITFTAAEQ